MGNSASRQTAGPSDAERVKLEALFQSSGDLLQLRSAFDGLSMRGSSGVESGDAGTRFIPHAKLQAAFRSPIPEGPATVQMALQEFKMHLVPEIFGQAPDGVNYAVFLGGVAKCGKLGSKGEQIEVLLRAFVGHASRPETSQQEERRQSGDPANTSAETSAPAETRGSEKSAKTFFSRERLEGILLASWYLTALNRRQELIQDGSTKKENLPEASHPWGAGEGQKEVNTLEWPDLRPLLNGAINSREKTGEPSSEDVDSDPELSLEQVLSWAVATLPGLSDTLEPFLVRRCGIFSKSVEGSKPEKNGKEADTADTAEIEESRQSRGSSDLHEETEAEGEAVEAWKPGMLSTGLAWGMGLALSSGTAKWGVGPRLIDLGCGGGDLTRLVGRPRLLYKSSKNGRGMNRFMSHVEGYSGTVLVIIAARTFTSGESWSIGALLPDGLANKRSFFGSSRSCLFSLKPTFKALRATSRESNFVYCHAKVAGQGYQTNPLPEGLGFGGSLGKERVWLDDNETPGNVTVRHHAVDKTFQPGALVPDLGYGGVEARVEDVEVWGLGGQQADLQQRAYLEREQRFQEQRRKIDMKKFAESWQDSPDRLILEWGGART